MLTFAMQQHNRHDGIAPERMERVLAHVDLDYTSLRYIHVTGTNGKGSTVNFIRSILESAGFSVGMFTSPHLLSPTERVVVGQPINEVVMSTIIEKYMETIELFHLSFFEIMFLVAIDYFLDQHVDYAIIEVGVGGTYDVTNVITPVVAAITNVALDHQLVLGHTKTAIAKQKIGIGKPNIPVFTTERDAAVLAVFHQYSDQVIEVPTSEWDIQLLGAHQQMNASLAAAVTKYLGVDDTLIKSGLKRASIAGRLQLIQTEPQVYIDVAHNGAAIATIQPFISELPDKKLVILGANKEKDYPHMLALLQAAEIEVVGCHFDDQKSASFDSIPFFDSFEAAYTWAEKRGVATIVVTGSFYFIQEVIQFFDK